MIVLDTAFTGNKNELGRKYYHYCIGDRLETIPEVVKPRSMGSVLAEMNNVMNDRYRVSEKQQGVSNLWFLIEGEDQIEQMVTTDAETELNQAKFGTWCTGILATSIDSINSYLESLPEQISPREQSKDPIRPVTDSDRPVILELSFIKQAS